MAFQTLIEPRSLRRLLLSEASAVIDCRFDLQDPEAGRRAFLAGHVPGAVYADMNKDLLGPITSRSGRHPLPEPQAFARRLGELGVGDDTQVIAYDAHNGAWAARLWWMLRWLGHSAVAVLDGGLPAWLADGGTLETGPQRAAPRLFTPRPAEGMHVSTDEVNRALADRARLLVDARAAGRFAGTAEPFDAVAGHIPGAVNHPMTANLAADGRFLPPEELRRRWQEHLRGIAPDQVIAMCGSGVTACHNLLSLEVAGLPGGRLYAGSWSEWIRDPNHPVARGV